MIELLQQLLGLTQLWLATAFAVFLRVGAAFLVLPALGDQMIPVRIRLGAALALSVFLTPLMIGELGGLGPGAPPIRAFFSEAVAGLILGLSLRLTVHALQIAGSIAAQSTSLSQIMGGASPDPQPAMGAILMLAGVTLALISGLHVHLVESFLRSYALLPFGDLPGARDLGGWGVAKVADSFALAFSLAAPFMVASLLYNVALGVINKAMPQLMVAFVGAPAITWGGLALLLVSMPFILPIWLASFEGALSNPLGAP
ncbi:Flagellar biosynthesis protein FliR [Roseibacterium elongatum DSM 19469]|uniref:Flagellar biosynthesis protein FliR n=1 Tax=Roseicyclus elongatus DSM 19469 TaxID=1294273 RepID=W8RRA4_9RHOB|nr:flagellar biosynthetic protein FliR [Roseibacterium elongatum]AHM03714.1 Flagellar biosynthesis protein FliR [Roseibacterium elongatum DSM 19469]